MSARNRRKYPPTPDEVRRGTERILIVAAALIVVILATWLLAGCALSESRRIQRENAEKWGSEGSGSWF